MTSVGLYNHTPSTNLADSAFPCASVGFEKTDTRGGKFWLPAPALFRAAESFSSTGNDGTAFRRSCDSVVPIRMMAEDDERFLRLPLSGSFCFRALPRLRSQSRPSVSCYFRAFSGFACSRMIVCGRNLLQKVRKSLLFSRECIIFAHGSSKKRDVWTSFRLPLRDAVRRDGRVVDYSSLENCRTERYRGFESLSLRKVASR